MNLDDSNDLYFRTVNDVNGTPLLVQVNSSLTGTVAFERMVVPTSNFSNLLQTKLLDVINPFLKLDDDGLGVFSRSFSTARMSTRLITYIVLLLGVLGQATSS